MSVNQAYFPVSVMARVLGVSKAGFYAWLRRPVSRHAQADAALLKRLRTVHATSRETYGASRAHAELRAEGEGQGRRRIVRLMHDAGLVGASSRRHRPIMTRRDKEARPAPDLVDRNFTADGPDQLWVADITFVPTAAGFLFLAVVLDAWSRKIVGWAMANRWVRSVTPTITLCAKASSPLSNASYSIAVGLSRKPKHASPASLRARSVSR